jgi:hypothetical protein
MFACPFDRLAGDSAGLLLPTAAAQFNAAEKIIDAQIAANQDSQWLMQQWLGSQGLPTSYPTQAALVAAYDAAREAEK